MAEDPEQYTMAPKSADLTILFSDVRGFTSISEALSPEHLREYINEYLTDMSNIIRGKYRGTLDKYIGDAIMAFWNAPVEDKDHPRNAVLAALEMLRECDMLNKKFTARGWPTLKIGIGVNSGNVRVGIWDRRSAGRTPPWEMPSTSLPGWKGAPSTTAWGYSLERQHGRS